MWEEKRNDIHKIEIKQSIFIITKILLDSVLK